MASDANIMTKDKPAFARRIFWDVDYDSLDIDAHSSYVIERVFERGSTEDMLHCRAYYGDEKVKKTLMNARFLMEHIMYAAAKTFNEKVENFRCYTLRQLNPELYPY